MGDPRRLALILLVSLSSVRAADRWPQWRGPRLNGVAKARGLPTTWSESSHVVWKAALPSWGGATPIVWDDRVWVISPSKTPEKPVEGSIGRKLPWGGREQPGGPDLLLLCFSRKDGSLLWQRTLDTHNQLYGKQNMASPSPVTDGKHVWAMTGTGVLTAFDRDGGRIWRRDLQKDFGRFGLNWGYASSPLLYQNLLIVEVLHGARTDDSSYVVAFDAATGETAWKVERPTDAPRESPDAYTTPTILRNGERDEIVICGADYLTGHDPKTGKELWRAGGLNPNHRGNFRICGSPVAADGMVYASSRVKPLLAFRAGGRGDITATHLAWRYEHKTGTDVPSVVCDGRYLYMVNDKGIATCLDAKTGKVIWGPKRTAPGTCSASPVLADGKLYVTNEGATTTVLAAGPDYKVLATNELEDGYTIASMAVAGSQIFLRTSTHLYCLGRVGK